MPLYEYECTRCGHCTEVIQRVGAAPPGSCPECGGDLRRLLSAPAFQFKGTGWYVTDYARKRSSSGEAPSGEASTEGGGAKPGKDSSDKKSDSKSDSASPSETAKAS